MGTYSTTTTLDTNMVGVTFDTVTTSLATNMITKAETEINKYLSKRYDISAATFQTSPSVPPVVKALCDELSEGYMWQKLSRGSKESLTRGKEMIEGVIQNLELYREAKADILNTAGTALNEASTSSLRIQCTTTDYFNTFNEDDELNWKVDPDKLDDIKSGRS